MAVAYLVDPNNQFMTKSGTINVGGHIRVYMAATDDIATTYKDFSGTLNPAVITLDDNGRCVIIADSETAYRIEVYDRYDSLLWTQEPVWCMAAGGGVSFVRVQSTDGTIVVNTTTEGSTTVYDLSTEVEKEPAPYGTSQLDVNALYATGDQFVALPWTSFGGDLNTNDGAWVIPYDAIADVDTDVVVTYDASLPKSSIFVRMEVEYGTESIALPTRELDMSQDCPSVHFSFKVPVHEGDTLTYKVYYQCAEGVTCGLDARSWLNLEVNNLGDDPNNDYNLLVNKPSINGVELVGDKSGSELHLQDKLTEGQYIHIDSANVISVSGLQPEGEYVYNSSFTAYTADASTSFVQQSAISSIENNITAISAELSGKMDSSASSLFQSAGNYQTAGDYAFNSALSSKLDATASSMFQSAGNYQTAGDYAYNSALSSKLDATASSMFQSAGNYQTAGDYAFNSSLSSKVDKSSFETCCNEVKSAISGKLDTSAFTSYTATATLTGDYLENSSFNIYSASANSAFVHTADMSGYQTKLEWGYDGQNNITSVDGSAFKAAAGGADYSGIDPIHVDNTARTIFVDHTGLSIDETMTAFPSGNDIVIGVNQDILSGKMDATASSNFYPSDNPSGFISSVDLSNYATTAYVDSSVSSKLDSTASSQFLTAVPAGYATEQYVNSSISGFAYESAVSAWTAKQDALTFGYNAANQISSIDGSALGGMDEAAVSAIASSYAESAASSKLDTTAYNSADFYSTSNPSGFIDSAYVDGAVSSKADSSALSSYALSADVSGTVDLVSTQSANWGGSALALSAGPGISLTQSGNTLIAAVDNDYIVTTVETVGSYNVTTADTQVTNTFSKAGYKPIAWEHKFGYATTLNFNEENTVVNTSNQLVYQGYIKNLGNDTKPITFKLHVSWVKVS